MDTKPLIFFKLLGLFALTLLPLIPALSHNWTRLESLDGNGLYVLEWHLRDQDIVFKATVNTRGFIALGFINPNVKYNAFDLVLSWVDDRSGKANVLDCHGRNGNFENVLQDDTQNYILGGEVLQNQTHTTITFTRSLETCDPRDVTLTGDTMKIFWAFGDQDILVDHLSKIKYKAKGSKTIQLLAPMFKKPKTRTHHDIKQWDVTVKNISIDAATDTLYWCKIIKAPPVVQTIKHHIIGYEALLSKESSTKKPLVHHMTLFECQITSFPGSDPGKSWEVWVKSNGAICNSNLLTPRDWDSCITVVATWGVGANGQFLPEHVGIPMGGKTGPKYYMLEIHYDNPSKKRILDHSGFRIHYTHQLRPNEGGILITGVSVSDTQMIPPGQKSFRNVGICGPSCTGTLFPKQGINIVSATLHSHTAGKQIKLRHIREGKELQRIVQDEHYNPNYQQVRQLQNETIVLPGDYIITDCAYDTQNRKRPIFGGYSTRQEVCLSFITYYPRIALAGCYSMTPVKEFFETFGVYEFYSMNMTDVENMFLYSSNVDFQPQFSSMPQFSPGGEIDDENNKIAIEALKHAKEYTLVLDEEDQIYKQSILNKLIISDPVEFHDRTFLSHLNQLPWKEPLFTQQVETTILNGKHMLFCRVQGDSVTPPTEIINFPNFTKLKMPPSICPNQNYLEWTSKSATMKPIKLFCIISSLLLLYTELSR